MPTAAALRAQIEAALAQRIPSALTPAQRVVRPMAPTGIASVDALLEGGLPLGAITEVVGPECSGRTTFALSFVAGLTRAGRVCAWIDVSDTLHPESAAAQGVDLKRLLWIRCGRSRAASAMQGAQSSFAVPEKYFQPPEVKKGLHGGGFGPHPRSEVRGLSRAVGDLLKPEPFPGRQDVERLTSSRGNRTSPNEDRGGMGQVDLAPRCAEPQRRVRATREAVAEYVMQPARSQAQATSPRKPWSRLDQALRITDLLLQGGGFSCLVIDMGSVAPEFVSRIPLASWFRYRAAAEQSQASILLLTQYACAKSSAELVLRLEPGVALEEETTVFAGMEHQVEIVRERFSPSVSRTATSAASPAVSNVVPLRKPPQRETGTRWRSRTTWTGGR